MPDRIDQWAIAALLRRIKSGTSFPKSGTSFEDIAMNDAALIL
jgi:hypothetical protein